jgi:hypothetical protein
LDGSIEKNIAASQVYYTHSTVDAQVDFRKG